MPNPAFTSPQPAETGTHSPAPQARMQDGNSGATFPPSSCESNAIGDVGIIRQHGAVDCCMRNRVQRIQKDLAAGRTVADEEIRRHIEDLRFLMESAHDRFLASGLPREQSQDLAQANEWRRLRDEALHMLSPEYKRARHLEVLRRADAEPGGSGCYFTDAADRDREAMAGNRQERG